MLQEVRGVSAVPLHPPPTGGPTAPTPGLERGENWRALSAKPTFARGWDRGRAVEDVTAAAATRRQSSRVGWERHPLCSAALGSPRGNGGEAAAAAARVPSRYCRGSRGSQPRRAPPPRVRRSGGTRTAVGVWRGGARGGAGSRAWGGPGAGRPFNARPRPGAQPERRAGAVSAAAAAPRVSSLLQRRPHEQPERPRTASGPAGGSSSSSSPPRDPGRAERPRPAPLPVSPIPSAPLCVSHGFVSGAPQAM